MTLQRQRNKKLSQNSPQRRTERRASLWVSDISFARSASLRFIKGSEIVCRLWGRQWPLSLAVLALVTCAIDVGGQGQVQPASPSVTQPYTMREDFQHESLGQWASYPPVQDIGYDPSLSPTTDYGAPGGRALMRIVRPNHAGRLRFGFIKRVRLLMTDDARLSFAYWLKPADNSGQIEIGLAGEDGRRYLARIPALTMGWARADVAIRDLRSSDGKSPAIGTGIEAIYLVADLVHADPDISYRFIIDDMALSAARAARFDVRQPPTVALEPWAEITSATGYRAGETIAIQAAAPVRLVSADCSMETQDGRTLAVHPLFDDGTHGDERAGDGVWSNDSIYTPRAADPTGVWVARLRGTTADERSIITPVRFIVRSSGRQGHPRLFFDPSARDDLIARTRHPKVAELWSKLQAEARSTRETKQSSSGDNAFARLDAEHLLPTLPSYFDVLGRARRRIAYNALDAYVTGNPDARAAAKSTLLEVARWERWAPPWFEAHGQHTYYPAGELSIDVAFGYDLLYDDLSESERALVRRALLNQSIIPTYKEYVLDNRLMAGTSNWLAHTVGGALVAVAAIAGEDPVWESDKRLELYLNGLLVKLEEHLAASYLPDGSYGEGSSYQQFDLETLTLALTALDRVFGVEYWKRSLVTKSLLYPLYTLTPPLARGLDMGDSSGSGAYAIAPLVRQAKDPTLRWYYDQFLHEAIRDFLFFDDSIAPQPPSLPTSRLFPDKGNAVFRTGWNEEDWVFLYHAGPNFNHNHADQGGFLLRAFGENLVTEAGGAHYYNDPYYAPYHTQAIGHNTVLVDGDPESQAIADTRQFAALNAYPRITDGITSEFYDAVSSELSAVYRGRLARFTRRIVFVKPHYFVVYDDLAANGALARFDWLLHLPDRSRIKLSPGSAVYAGEKAALAMRLLFPAASQTRAEVRQLPYANFPTNGPPSPPLPGFLDVSTTEPSSAMQFLVALVPARTAEDAQAIAARLSGVTDRDWIGVRTERGAEQDLVMFRTSSATSEARHGEWATDAAVWMVTLEDGRAKMLAVQAARTLTHAGRRLVASEWPISLAADYRTGKIAVAVSAAMLTRLQLFVGANPGSVQLDNDTLAEEMVRFDRPGGMISVMVPAGQHRITISLGKER